MMTAKEILGPLPEFFNFATDVVDRWAKDPQKLALHWVDQRGERERRLTFADVRDQSRSLAGELVARGLVPGDRVGIVIGREPAWWIGMIAILRAGMIAVPGTTQLTSRDLLYRIRQGSIRGFLADEASAEKLDAVREHCPEVKAWIATGSSRPYWQSFDDAAKSSAAFSPVATRADDPALLYFTSGTTGPPKRVLHTHVSYPLGHSITGKLWLDLKSDDLHWNLSDTGWAKAAWSSLFGPWSQGAAIFVQEPGPRFEPLAALATIRRFPITTFCAPPTVYRQLVTCDLGTPPLGTLRHAVAAGEPLNPEVIAAWERATGIVIRDGFGQTETTLLAGNFPGEPVRPGSMGKAAPGFAIEILDDDLQPLPADQEGEIAVRIKPERPIGLFLGYEGNPEENGRKFQGDYYLTGDRGRRDADGYLWFVGRNDDIILSAGYRIGPFEVESALIEHPAVQEAAVISVPDPVRYEIVKAFVLLAPGYSPSAELAGELQEHVRRVTAPYKYPREVEFVESLPKTVSGKIRRVELREREARRSIGQQ
ncbi:MAG: AMP-binding protein [Planctomycetota bacterium]